MRGDSNDSRDLLAKVDPAVRAANCGVDSIAGLKVLRSAALRLEKQLPKLTLRQELRDPSNCRGGRCRAQPAGVPVSNTSPGSMLANVDNSLIVSAGLKTRLAVLSLWRTTLLT